MSLRHPHCPKHCDTARLFSPLPCTLYLFTDSMGEKRYVRQQFKRGSQNVTPLKRQPEYQASMATHSTDLIGLSRHGIRHH